MPEPFLLIPAGKFRLQLISSHTRTCLAAARPYFADSAAITSRFKSSAFLQNTHHRQGLSEVDAVQGGSEARTEPY